MVTSVFILCMSTVTRHWRTCPVPLCSVSLAPHDGTGGFAVLCDDLASGKGRNLDLLHFQYEGSSTQLALLNGFHTEIIDNRR